MCSLGFYNNSPFMHTVICFGMADLVTLEYNDEGIIVLVSGGLFPC